jgi:hypothetical protein
MERQLFDWDSLVDLGDSDYVFYNITLKQAIKGHPIGTKFYSALLSFESGTLQLMTENYDIVVEVELGLFVK